MSTTPSTQISRLREKQDTSRDRLDELLDSTPLAAVGDANWSLKIGGGWPEDPEEDIASGVWAGVVPMTVSYGAPLTAPDVLAGTPVPASVHALSGNTPPLPR